MTVTGDIKESAILEDLSTVRTPSFSRDLDRKCETTGSALTVSNPSLGSLIKSMTCGFCASLSNLLFGSDPDTHTTKDAIVTASNTAEDSSSFIMDKNTVFVWDGLLETQGLNSEGTGYDVKWHGVVVANPDAASANAVPEPPRNAFKEFVDSDLQFNVHGTAKPVDGNPKDDNKFKEHVVSLTSGEGWDFQGAKNVDHQHDLHVTSLLWRGSPDQRNSIVVAKGKSSHGPFLSVGWMRPGNRVTLARRYLNDNDPRASWSVEQVRSNILQQIYSEDDDTIVMPPWKCEALNA